MAYFKALPDTNATSKPDRFALFSITKSGTHMAMNLLNQLTGYVPNDQGDEDLGDVKQYNWYHMHIFPKIVKKLFKRDKELKKILLVRDLRAASVSLAFWIQKPYVGMLSEGDKKILSSQPNDREKIKWTLNHEYDDNGPIKWGFHLSNQANLTCGVMNKKNVLLVRFENLIGSKGGGSDELQFKEVKKIAEFINAPIKDDDEKLREIALSLFGNSGTFRKGQIDGWQQYFDEEISAIFDQKLLKFQKRLGYK